MKKTKSKKIIAIIIAIVIIIIAIISIFFLVRMSKKIKIGNNKTSQEIVENMLTINQYETEIEVEIESNKNRNKYKIKQQYNKSDFNYQEIIEPSNISGVKIIREGNKLKIENSKLELSTIFENYEYLSENILDLSCFIENYKNNEKSAWKEEENKRIMITKKNNIEKILEIDKQNSKPIKMKIKDNNRNTNVYILYSKVDYKNK